MVSPADRTRITVRRDLCIGAGQCVLAAPAVFDQGDDGLVRLPASRPEPAPEVLEAVRLCPSGALSLADMPPAGARAQ